MPRLRNAQTGVVVNVDDDTASRLDQNWGDADTVPAPVNPAAPGAPAAPAAGSGGPRGNASREDWAAYADSLGVTYDPEAKREDIKEAIAAAADGGESTPKSPEEPEKAPEGDDN